MYCGCYVEYSEVAGRWFIRYPDGSLMDPQGYKTKGPATRMLNFYFGKR